MSKDLITGKIIQDRQKEKIQFQTSFTDFPTYIWYCKYMDKSGQIKYDQVNKYLGLERNKNSNWKQKEDSHARISLEQYNLIIREGNMCMLSELGKELISLFDDDAQLIGSREQYIDLTYRMITSWHQNNGNYNIHPGTVILKLLLEPSLHGFITSQDIAHIFNNSNNKNDSQYSEMLNQIIEFRNSGHLYKKEELKKTYTLLTGYVKWDIFNLDEQNSNSIIKTVFMQEDFRNHVKSRLHHQEDTVLDDNDFKQLIQETDDFKVKIEHYAAKYGESGRVSVTYESRISQVQNAFRNRLIQQFGQKCMLCNITNKELLVASHIKRDADCDTIEEKIDNNNGFLLCANHDKLFDRFLISFDGLSGKIMISSKITEFEKNILLLDSNYVLPPELLTPERQIYLIWHNSEFISKENGDN